MMRSVVNSWMRSEWARLAGTSSHGEIARDLADAFVQDLNSQLGSSLAFACAPDTEQRNAPAPDLAYVDRNQGVSVALEITRLYDRQFKECQAGWSRFARNVEQELSAAQSHYHYYLIIPEELPAPVSHAEAHTVARALAAMPDEGIDLGAILGASVRAGRRQQATRVASVEAIVLKPAHYSSRLYTKTLREANAKLADWHLNSYETFLLYDGRMIDTLSSHLLDPWGPSHDAAYMYAARNLGDPRLDGCPFSYEDFSNVDHVIALHLSESGLSATGLWRHPSCQLPQRLPDKWIIRPANWYED